MNTDNVSKDKLPKPKRPFAPTTLADVAGCLKYEGEAKTIEEMETAVWQGIAEDWQELAQQYTVDNDTWIPHEIVKATTLGDVSPIRAWREYLNLTQQELAQQAGISQPALARLEKNDAQPRAATLKKLAAAMNITVAQLSD